MQGIEIKNLTYTYSQKTPYEKKALDNVSLNINEGDFVGIIGHTGSGKSTLIQHINGLIKPQSGSISVMDINLNQKKPKPDLKRLRTEVGMVFQYPEHQLFDDTVEKDIGFGPKNLKLSTEEIKQRVQESMELVGLDYNDFKDRSPFDLSGGQKRRVAIAGVIAMRPKILILDEPTAGLDPEGKEHILTLISKLKNDVSPTVIVISHDIDEITRFATRLIVFNNTKIAFDIPMAELFKHEDELVSMGLAVPMAVRIANSLKKKGIALRGNIITPQDLNASVEAYYNNKFNNSESNVLIDSATSAEVRS